MSVESLDTKYNIQSGTPAILHDARAMRLSLVELKL